MVFLIHLMVEESDLGLLALVVEAVVGLDVALGVVKSGCRGSRVGWGRDFYKRLRLCGWCWRGLVCVKTSPFCIIN